MTKKNKIREPLIIVWSVILLLLLVSFFRLPVIPYLNSYSKIDILKDLRPGSAKDLLNKKDTSAVYSKGRVLIKGTRASGDNTFITDYSDSSANPLSLFFTKLDKIKSYNGKVRVAYFGDSFIEADYVTDEIRKHLQELYGGNGVGFLPMQSIVADSYRFIKFSSDDSWTDHSFKSNPQKLPLGLSGHLFFPEGEAWSKYSAPAKGEKISQVKLYTGKTPAGNELMTVSLDGIEQAITINNSNDINETVLSDKTPVNEIKVSSSAKDLPVYGVSVEGNTGFYLDNYGFRGNTGALSLQIPVNVMSEFNSYFKYDLIILHYGLNAVEHNSSKSAWFENAMTKLIQNIKQGFPGVPILLISTSDFAFRDKGQYVTEPAIIPMVKKQQQIAMNSKVAFWDLFDAMGGENTIVHWVEGDTALAYKDYMHPNARGSKKIADIFLDKLFEAKKYYTNPSPNKK